MKNQPDKAKIFEREKMESIKNGTEFKKIKKKINNGNADETKK